MGVEGMEGKAEGQWGFWQPHKDSSSLRKVKWKSNEASLCYYDLLRCLSVSCFQPHGRCIFTVSDFPTKQMVSQDPSTGVMSNQFPAEGHNCDSFLQLSDAVWPAQWKPSYQKMSRACTFTLGTHWPEFWLSSGAATVSNAVSGVAREAVLSSSLCH